MRFQIIHHLGQVHIVVRMGNNKIVLSGERLHNPGDAFSTIMSIKEHAPNALVEERVNVGTWNEYAVFLWTPTGEGVASIGQREYLAKAVATERGDTTDQTHPFHD